MDKGTDSSTYNEGRFHRLMLFLGLVVVAMLYSVSDAIIFEECRARLRQSPLTIELSLSTPRPPGPAALECFEPS